MEIGSRIRNRREGLGLTQQELARELGVTHQHVSRLESGAALPSLELVARLSRFFGVTADYLLSGEEKPAMSVAAAIRADPELGAATKRHLIALIDELKRPRYGEVGRRGGVAGRRRRAP